MKKLENLYRQNLRRMRKTLESKLEKSPSVIEEQKMEKQRRISRYIPSNIFKTNVFFHKLLKSLNYAVDVVMKYLQ